MFHTEVKKSWNFTNTLNLAFFYYMEYWSQEVHDTLVFNI